MKKQRPASSAKPVMNAWERQARILAGESRRGRQGLGRSIFPVPAAGKYVPGSAGAPLPFELRARLEKQFDADLSLVRIHADRAGDAAARDESAEAFAAGNRIFFRSGAFAPHSASGQELIAHEVVHVLQQAGRRNSDGGLRVAAVSGTGDVQRKERDIFPRGVTGELALQVFVDRYRPLAGPGSLDTAAFDAMAEDVSKELEKDGTGGTLAARAEGGAWDASTIPRLHREFVTDVLRERQQPEAVAYLLTVDPEMRCTMHSEPAAVLAAGMLGPGWTTTQTARDPFQDYFPGEFIDSYRRYLLGPTRTVQALHSWKANRGDFIPKINQIWDDASAGTGLIENELYFYAMYEMRLLDQDRQKHLFLHKAVVDKSYSAAPEAVRRMRMAQLLHDDFKAMESSAKFQNGSGMTYMYFTVAPTLVTICQQAKTTWEMAILDEHAPARKEKLQPIAAGKEGEALRKKLAEISTSLLDRPGGLLPDPKIYNDKVIAAKKQLKTFAYDSYEAKLIDLSRKDWNADMALWYAAVLYTLDELRAVLELYLISDDKAFLNGLPDVRVKHRLQVAYWLASFAPVFGWTELGTLADQVLTARQSGQTANEVAITGTWQRDNRAQIADLAGDEKGFFAHKRIERLGGLTSLDLAHVFLTEYYAEYAGKIDAIMQAEGSDFSQLRARIVPRARDAMVDFDRPKRYILPAGDYWRAAAPEGSEEAAGRDTTALLVRSHPVTRNFIRFDLNATDRIGDMTDVNPFVIASENPPAGGQPYYFWTIPPLAPLVKRLQKIPELDALVRAKIADDEAAVSKAKEVSQEESPLDEATETPMPVADWFVWFKAFLALGNAVTKENAVPKEIAEHLKRFSKDLGTEMGEASRSLMLKKREAETQDRLLCLKFQVRPLMEAYETVGLETFTNPSEALQRMEEFALSVQPHEEERGEEKPDLKRKYRGDQEAHMALLMLELLDGDEGEKIADKLKKIDRYDLIVIWMPELKLAKRMAVETPIFLAPLFAEGESSEWAAGLAPRLDGVLTAMEERQKAAQYLTGFIARTEGIETEFSLIDGVQQVHRGPVLEDTISGRRMTTEEPFKINGVEWKLVEVKEQFEFHPDWGVPGSDAYRASILVVGSETIPVNNEGKRDDTRELLTVIRNGVKETITAADPNNRLEELSNAVGMQALVQSMAQLQEFIETYVQIILDAAEFIPGAGQALMVARLVASILEFVASDEFEEIKDTVVNNPRVYIDEIAGLVGAKLDPISVAEWMLFHGNAPAALNSLTGKSTKQPMRKPPTRASKPGTLAKLGNIIGRIRGVGAGLYRSFDRAKDRAGRAVMGMETYVHTRPAALAAVNYMADHIAELSEAKERIEEIVKHGGDMAKTFKNFPERVDNLVGSLREMQIPREIVPMGELLGIVVELVLDRLGAKYKVAGRLILLAIEKLGYREQLFKALAARIPEEIDPNFYWEKFVDRTLTPKLDSFREELVGGINNVFGKVGLAQITDNQVPKVTLTMSGEEFAGSSTPSVSPKLASHEDEPAPYWGPLPAVTGGSALGRSMRSKLEAGFGHDLSHVRLHRGEEARQMTGRFGADALASGSHVYLRPGIAPESDRGGHLLRHELGHVLQQTGARPLGGRHSGTPSAGAPQRGLEYSSAAEAAADRMAAASAKNSGGPVKVEEDRTYGPQPALPDETIGRLLRRIVRGEALKEHYDRILNGTPIAANLSNNIETEIAHVATGIDACWNDEAKFIVDKPFSTVRNDIAAYAKNLFQVPKLKEEVKCIALESLVLKTVPPGAPTAAQQEPEYELSARWFQLGLEGLLLSGGLATDVELDKTASGSAGLNASAPVKTITLLSLDMAGVRDATLWELLLSNTFNPTERPRLEPRARVILAAKPPTPILWDSVKFALSNSFANTIRNYAEGGKAVDPADLPAPDFYTNPAEGGPYVALHTGTHQELSGPKKATERESHHTTQFVLLEYFRNWKDKDKQPFKHLKSAKDDLPKVYPGLSLKDYLPGAFSGSSGEPINIASMTGANKEDRGPGMPAVSLSKIAHRLGRVHISAEPDDNRGDSLAPGTAVKNKFFTFLGGGTLANAMLESDDDLALRDEVAKDSVGVQNKIHEAMQETYKWMREDMMNRLQVGLEDQEVEYYNALATPKGASAPPAGKALKATDMAGVMGRVKANNKKVMETAHHWS